MSDSAAGASEAPPIEQQVEQLSIAQPPEAEKPHPSGLSLEERFQLCRSVAEECVSEDELRKLLNKPVPIAYDGFEPSGACAMRACLAWALSGRPRPAS